MAWPTPSPKSLAMALHPLSGINLSAHDLNLAIASIVETLRGSVLPGSMPGASTRLPRGLAVLGGPVPGDEGWMNAYSSASTVFWQRIMELREWSYFHEAVSLSRAILKEQQGSLTSDGFSLGSFVLGSGGQDGRLSRMSEPGIFLTAAEAHAGVAVGEVLECELLAQIIGVSGDNTLVNASHNLVATFSNIEHWSMRKLRCFALARLIAHILEYQNLVGDLPAPDAYLRLLQEAPRALSPERNEEAICPGGLSR